jgi:hypothetical protein
METMEVANVRRGVDGYWREDEIYGAHTLLGGDGRGDMANVVPATLRVKV